MRTFREDFNEALDLLKEKRLEQIWDPELKRLSSQESEAEREYQALELDDKTRSVIEKLILCMNELDGYTEKLVYKQGLKDGYCLAKIIDNENTL